MDSSYLRPYYGNGNYVGRDGREFLSVGGTSIANPNYNRLTFLFSHLFEEATNNHFHAIGA
ncbi:hypothetical protein F7734_19955 [Scytonema sp. UIC 10036]|uniref:hypothetical protein n=1 Tax=Scytonema sp. UIC 10036 TaxID=2304196 RepID=UPI0012DA26C8|nr:hypothetical protein [Scytonema sp. UIC 10036]MUG94526.1 hypothetical protein [Scytonema sp. UIC 10036]